MEVSHFLGYLVTAFILSATQARVIKSKVVNVRHSTNRQNEDISISTLKAADDEKRSFGKKVGGFLGGKMFDYFLTRLFLLLLLYC